MLVNSDFTLTVLKVSAANRLYHHPSEAPVQRRCRKRWAVALKSTGTTYYTCGGKRILSDRLHPVLLPKGCTYSWQCVEAGECLIIEFDALEEAEMLIPFTVTDSGFFLREFPQIQKALHSAAPEAQIETTARLYNILLQLLKNADREYVPKEKRQLLTPAIGYMEERYFDPHITNDLLAGLCGLSTVYFRKCFAGAFGLSPIRYLHQLRIRRAKDILSSDYGSISQVAESVGYSSVYHFSKMFKLYTGISPTQYAKASRK